MLSFLFFGTISLGIWVLRIFLVDEEIACMIDVNNFFFK